jgi:hypothetical protein
MTDPTPHHRRSPLEHERDAGPDLSAEALDAQVDDSAELARKHGIHGTADFIRALGREITALRARLAESEAERLEQARLLGMSGERELALRARLAEAEARAEAIATASDSGWKRLCAQEKARAERAEAAVERAARLAFEKAARAADRCADDGTRLALGANAAINASQIAYAIRALDPDAIAAEARGETP